MEYVARVRIAYVIQETDTGLFLAEDLSWVQSFRNAGRLYDREEAVDTAVWNAGKGGWEIHQFLVRVEG